MTKLNRKITVSVIMPVYNAGDFLREAIESILNQTYKNFEFIIVDDASTDDSWKIISAYQRKFPSKIKAVRLKNNLNMGGDAAGNVGFKHASGEFIARMDADDVAKPTRLEKQTHFLLSHPDISVLGSCADVIDKNGKIVGEKIVPESHTELYKSFFILHPMIHPSVMVRKASLNKARNLYLVNNPSNNDYLTFFAMISKEMKFANLREKLLFYRIHGKNDSLASVRKTFLNSLRTRFKAVFEFGYKPTPLAIVELFAQTILVFILPERIVFKLYLIVSGINKLNLHLNFPNMRNFARVERAELQNEAIS